MAFNDAIKLINAINELILEGLTDGSEKYESREEFNNHLRNTKSWYIRTSCVDKKLYMLALLENVHSAWTISLLLKSIWNCRPKDSVLSISGPVVLSAYDQSPLDNKRTVIPVKVLAQVMNDDRQWFISLEPESQAIVLLELLAVAGGPVLWQVLSRAQRIYERYRKYEIDRLKESVVLIENVGDVTPAQPVDIRHGKDILESKTNVSGVQQMWHISKAQNQLDDSLAVWNSSIKTISDSFKIEEIETTFKDGSKKKIWKVERPMHEVTETVDFLQLLPSAIAKRVLKCLPFAQLNEHARVNKYWAYLIEEFKAEMLARQKISVELEKLRDVMMRNNDCIDSLGQSSFRTDFPETQHPGQIHSIKSAHGLSSIRVNQKSGPYSFRDVKQKVKESARYTHYKEVRKISSQCKKLFPLNFMLPSLKIPLSKPLIKDPAAGKFNKKSITSKVRLSKNTVESDGQDSKR